MSAHKTPEQIRASLDHPVVDGDGHWLEFTPVFSEKMRKAVGDKAADGFLAAMKTTTDALKMTQAARDDARVAMPELLEPPGREHARPRDRDDAEDAVRAARRDRHGFRRDLPDRRAAPAAHQGRRDAARRHPRLQHRVGRLFPRPRRPHDAGGDHPDAHAGRGDRGARVRHEAARRPRSACSAAACRAREPTAPCGTTCSASTARTTTTRCGRSASSSRSRRPSTAARAARACATRRPTSSTTTSAISRRPATRSPRPSSSAA